MSTTCSTCRFWAKHSGYRHAATGDCRFHAPVAFWTSQKEDFRDVRRIWPTTYESDGCGDHAPMPAEATPVSPSVLGSPT